MNHQYQQLQKLLGLPADADVVIEGSDPLLPTRFKLAETAAGVIGAIGSAAAQIAEQRCGCGPQSIRVQALHAAATLNSYRYHRISGGMDPMENFASRSASGATAIYPTRDGRFFHAHGSFDPEGMCTDLGVKDPNPEKMAEAIGQWDGLELENYMFNKGRCGAMLRSAAEWDQHEHGKLLGQTPVVEIVRIGDSAPEPFAAAKRPLDNIRVLDLTRVLAGPTCARTLAEHGADVLRIGAQQVPTHEFFDLDTGHGKRWANLNLKASDGRAQLAELISSADIFSEGYRPGVMARFGFSADELHNLRPGIINVSINCYGHAGPFSDRPGWEQLGQSVSGMAIEEGGAANPRLVPAAACDYTTGYLAALGALVALNRRAREGGSYAVRVSLARTGMWYMQQPKIDQSIILPTDAPGRDAVSQFMTESDTYAGRLIHLKPVVGMSETPPHWSTATPAPGSSEAAWQ